MVAKPLPFIPQNSTVVTIVTIQHLQSQVHSYSISIRITDHRSPITAVHIECVVTLHNSYTLLGIS